ncbi:MAG TPA: hypothetical protein VGB01_00075 [candidate division Zixibacteria bacterium]
METANWIIAISTTTYALVVIFTIFYIAKQLRESKLLREASVLKEVYDYVIRTHNCRKIIYHHKDTIMKVKSQKDLENLEINYHEITDAIHEVANCYHYIGFLINYGLLSNKSAIFEEGGDTILHVYDIIKPVIEQDRKRMSTEKYKQYLEYLVKEINAYKKCK